MKSLLDPITKKLNSWLESSLEMLPNLAVAIIVLILFVLVARLVHKLVLRILKTTYKNSELSSIIAKIIKIVVIVLGLMFALSLLHLDKTVSSVLAGAGVIGIALSFAFQDIAANFVSGLIMAAKRPFEIGDIIEVEGKMGTVLSIHLRTTEIMTPDGNEVLIPNRFIFENAFTNYFKTKSRRVDLAVGVSYAENLEEVQEIAIKAISSLRNLSPDHKVEAMFTEFGDSSINLMVYYWIPYDTNMEYLRGISDGVIAIKKAFDKNGISIPFPIRTLDFGIKGGEPLSESLSKSKENESE